MEYDVEKHAQKKKREKNKRAKYSLWLNYVQWVITLLVAPVSLFWSHLLVLFSPHLKPPHAQPVLSWQCLSSLVQAHNNYMGFVKQFLFALTAVSYNYHVYCQNRTFYC
jgi:hypothetical protein